MKRWLRYIIFFLVVGLLWGSFFLIYRVYEYGDVSRIKEVVFYVRNERSNGTSMVDIEYNLDFNKSLSYSENIHNNLSKAELSPFYIDFRFYSNATFGYSPISSSYSKTYLDTGYMPIASEGVDFNLEGLYDWEIKWHKSKLDRDYFDFRLYMSDIIKRPTAEEYSLNLEMRVYSYNESDLNNTLIDNHEFELYNFANKEIELTQSNIDFYMYDEHRKTGTDFYHQTYYNPWMGNFSFVCTRSNIQFSTLYSRRTDLKADMFYDLFIMFPITTVIPFVVLEPILAHDSKEDKELINTIKLQNDALKEQNEKMIQELAELKEMIVSNNGGN